MVVSCESERYIRAQNVINKMTTLETDSLNIFYCQNIYSIGVGSQVLTTLSTLPLHSIYTQ